MINEIAHVALLVRDYDEAIEFYCGKIGFIVIEDTKLIDKRWVRIKPSENANTELLLSKAIGAEQSSMIGKQAGGRVFLFLHSDDLMNDVSKLKKAQVDFVEEPRTEVYGKVAVFKDLYGNRIDLIQPSF